MAGWVKIHRALQNWEWWHDDKMLRVFLTILLNANHEDGRWRGHEVKRGQWITGRKKLAEVTGISERSIRTILKRLEDSQEVTIKTTSKFSLITLIKWDSYQVIEQPNDQQNANKRPATDQRPTTNKNEKKVKKESKTSLPENFIISDRVKEWAVKGNHNPTQDDLEAFCLHHEKKGNKFANWDSAFMTWMRNKKRFSNDQGSADEPRNKRLN